MPPKLMPYWSIKDNLHMVDCVVMINDQVLLPPPLREDAAKSLVNGTSLDSDSMVRALLMYRNTPNPGSKLSPAQILLLKAPTTRHPSIH